MSTRICKFCGEEFTPRSNRQVYCSREHWRRCPSCGQMYLERYHENLSKPPRLCCSNCVSKNQASPPPEFKVIAEINNTVIVNSTSTREKYDNLHITKYYQKLGKESIHVFPDDPVDKILKQQEIQNVSSASEYEVYRLHLDYAQEFLEENDIVRYYSSTSLALGLVKSFKIYQVMTFSAPRYKVNYDYEIVRCCSRLGYKILGGLDRLSSEASLSFDVASCIAYQDISKGFSDKIFQSIGMNLHHVNPPRLRSSGVFDCGTGVYVFS